MFELRLVRTISGHVWLLAASLLLAACNSGSTLTPADTIEPKTHALIGSQSGDLRVVRALSAPEYIQNGESQHIFKNDLLRIKVFQVEKLDRYARVDSRGMIDMPLIGAVSAAGKSVPELEKTLERRYGASYLQNPDISVYVKESSGQKVVVDGSFKRPGVFRTSSQSTLLRVVAQAAGLDDIADENKIFVYRKYKNENQVAQYNLEAIRNGQRPDPAIFGGDVVVAFPSDTKVAVKNLKEALGIASTATRAVMPF